MGARIGLRQTFRAVRRRAVALADKGRPVVLRSHGTCPICGPDAAFVARDPWLRDHFLCTRCGSIPRERALMQVIASYYPAWRALTIHESSPSPRGASKRLADACPHYFASQFFPDAQPGSQVRGVRCENLEDLSLDDESVDLHITQDVLEHVFEPARVFRELARTLRPGGAHIFTVPLVNRCEPTRRRARRDGDGTVAYLAPAQYHGNPISNEGSLVTFDWGLDICRHIHEACGLHTAMVCIDNLALGIRAELIEVLITRKPRDVDAGLPC